MTTIPDDITRALQIARGYCRGSSFCTFSMRYCPVYWRRVFIAYYSKKPIDDKDPLWDKLLKIGLPALTELQRKESEAKAAE